MIQEPSKLEASEVPTRPRGSPQEVPDPTQEVPGPSGYVGHLDPHSKSLMQETSSG